MTFTWTEIRQNNLKTSLLFFVFFGLIAAISTVLGLMFNSLALGWSIGLILFLAYGAFAYYRGSQMALSLNNAQKADERQYRQLHNIVEELSIAASLPKPDVYIINEDAPNAFATGMNPDQSAVAVTTGLLNIMDRDEVSGVIAHELAHIESRDTKTMLIAGVLVGSIVILADIIFHASLFGGNDRGNWVYLIVGILASMLAPLIAQIIKLAVSRKREYAADAKAAQYTRNPEGLASALEKLGSTTKKMDHANRSLNHLYINSELDGSFFNNLFSTHPPIEDRVKRLRDL